ncbi:MAG: rod shape-determining protein RodA [Cyanobacteria bacterium P01_H01_bin.15]
MRRRAAIRRLHFLSAWPGLDWSLMCLVAGLTAFGGLMIYSTEIADNLSHGWQHWLFGGVGLFIAFAIATLRYDRLLQWHWVIYGLTNLSLIAVMVIGSSAKGAQRWISIGGITIQPSEFAKIGVIITLAAVLHLRPAKTLTGMFRALAITSVPWGLVFLQPDLGTSLAFGAIVMAMLFWSQANPGWLLLLASPVGSALLFNVYFPGWLLWSIAIVVTAWTTLPWKIPAALGALGLCVGSGKLGSVFWNILKDYQKDRLILFLDPEQDPLGGGYHLIQSRIAIGAGELWGRGFSQGTQTQLNFIPEQHTDFIFSAVGEELGFVGCIAVLIVFWLICLRLVAIALSSKDNFGSLLAIGVLAMVAFQTVVNISMTVGLAPITGLPLPWMSYGRSSLLTNFIALGLVESVANFRHRKSFQA